ncbi:MAG: aminotransferase class I/II-fold pyridoxal phosphate-dependent enzyme [Firmicutes bacterium]|nr:aminotransferase class I/II-fold pyridoxal phosphate-dependent enzyme [Bacillota bacterium]
MVVRPANRIQRLPDQLFAHLVQAVEDKRQQGIDVINLGQGNPDQPTPAHIVESLKAAAENPRYHRYISFRGLVALKEAVARWYWERYAVTLDPQSEIAILIGSKIGIEELSLALINPGEGVLVPDPGYPDYLSGIYLAGGTLHSWPLLEENHFLPPLDHWPDNTRLAFVNFPNNPTGRMAPAAYFDQLIDRALSRHVLLAHDLAYGDITFDGRQAVSLLARPGGKEAGVEFTTLSKSYNMAGWRIGFAAGHPDVIRYLELLQDHLHCSQWGAIQEAAIAALTGPQESVQALCRTYQSRRDAFLAEARRAGWDIPPSEGSIFIWCPVPRTRPSLEWAHLFLSEAEVMVAPGSAFGMHGEGYVRVALTEPADRLVEAARRLARIIQREAAASHAG